MVKTTIREQACRGCQMCIEICPLDVFVFDEASFVAKVDKPSNCIACLSCNYRCPSGAIEQSDYHQVKNFYHDVDFSRQLEKFL